MSKQRAFVLLVCLGFAGAVDPPLVNLEVCTMSDGKLIFYEENHFSLLRVCAACKKNPARYNTSLFDIVNCRFSLRTSSMFAQYSDICSWGKPWMEKLPGEIQRYFATQRLSSTSGASGMRWKHPSNHDFSKCRLFTPLKYSRLRVIDQIF